MTQAEVLALLSGTAQPFARGELSAIAKGPIAGPVKIGRLGIEGDEQADPRYHGGPDKALHHYPSDHYVFWGSIAIDHPLLNTPGAFGENVSTWGFVEEDVCIGDRFRLGSSILEISQGRQPCWKQGQHMGWAALPALMVKERRSGWYYRVIEEGFAKAGNAIELIERPLSGWTVKRVFGLLIGGDHKKDPAVLKELVAMEVLHSGWRKRASELLESQR